MSSKFLSLFMYITDISFLISASNLNANEWQNYTMSTTDLPSNNIFCIAVDQRGTKWFGTDQGLVKFDGINWITFSSEVYQNKWTTIQASICNKYTQYTTNMSSICSNIAKIHADPIVFSKKN